MALFERETWFLPAAEKARKAVRRALEIQRDGKGYAFVEVLAGCPTNLKLDPIATNAFINDQMTAEFPLKTFRDRSEEVAPLPPLVSDFTKDSLDRLFGLPLDSTTQAATSSSVVPGTRWTTAPQNGTGPARRSTR